MHKFIGFIFIFLISFLFFVNPGITLAHQPRLIYGQQGEINIYNPEISQAFYDELKSEPRNYIINSDKDFELYINLLTPELVNRDGRYSADVFSAIGGSASGGDWEKIYSIDWKFTKWEQYYEQFGREYYLKGPEFTQQIPAGEYKIEVFSKDNLGKYVLVVGKTEFFDAKSILNIYWQIPLLKVTFFKTSVLQFFLTPFGIAGVVVIGALLIFLALIYYLVGLIKKIIKNNQAKTLLLASSFPEMRDEIIKLLQKPAYDVTVGFVNTASKSQENLDYVQRDLGIMKEMGFNVEEIDITGKKEHEVMKFLELKDIIFVEGGNTFYLLKAMRECNFEKVMRKLLKQGKVYIGVSAGSMVAGRTIETSVWRGEAKGENKNLVGLKNLRGMNFIPYDIFVHYKPEFDEIIKKKMPDSKKREKRLKIISDGQGILVQGNEIDLIGDGEEIIL